MCPLSIRTAPFHNSRTSATLIITYVTGFVSAEIRPTINCILVNALFSSEKRVISSCSLWKARITRTPVRFWRTLPNTWSSFSWTLRYNGIVINMIPKTTIASNGMTIANTTAAFTSTVNDITIAPNTINGERKSRRSTIFVPDWIWLISLVIRVIMVEVPISSISRKEILSIFANNPCRSFAANPTAAFAAKYCAVIEQVRPTSASRINTPP